MTPVLIHCGTDDGFYREGLGYNRGDWREFRLDSLVWRRRWRRRFEPLPDGDVRAQAGQHRKGDPASQGD